MPLRPILLHGGELVELMGWNDPGTIPVPDTFILGATQPTISNAGPAYPEAEALQVLYGNQTISVAGTVWERKVIYGGTLTISANNVTVRNCYIYTPATSVRISGINISPWVASGIIIERNHIEAPLAYRSYLVSAAIRGRGFTAIRNRCIGFVDAGITSGVNGQEMCDSIWRGNYMITAAQATDPEQGDGITHNDAIQAEGNISLEIVGNTLIGGRTSAILLTNNVPGGYGQAIITDNWLYGHPTQGATINVSGTNINGLQVKRNRVDRAGRSPRLSVTSTNRIAANFGMVGASGNTSGWTAGADCNVFMDDGSPVPVSNG